MGAMNTKICIQTVYFFIDLDVDPAIMHLLDINQRKCRRFALRVALGIAHHMSLVEERAQYQMRAGDMNRIIYMYDRRIIKAPNRGVCGGDFIKAALRHKFAVARWNCGLIVGKYKI